ncbi:hypothetical protein GCM10009817_10410 [Terrabacter lapilli]|uniref:Metallothionein n=2 Tax=Terrabacter lapilli TaxID=436231 RepID=A0ABN2RNJ8_9MICO
MAVCDMCGNDYARSFTITRDDRSRTYDSLECAITDWAPACGNCGCRVLGHGVEVEDAVFCCQHCADAAGRGRSPHGIRPRS